MSWSSRALTALLFAATADVDQADAFIQHARPKLASPCTAQRWRHSKRTMCPPARTTRIPAWLSSPFHESDAVQGEAFDKQDAMQKEAEQLEDMIRGSRGVSVEAIKQEWIAELFGTLDREGARLYAEAAQGFRERGRGAMYVNVDVGLSGSSKGHEAATCHAVYRPLSELVTERSPRIQRNDQVEIIQRCQQYDPETGFVIVFGHKGMVGVQQVRPKAMPKSTRHSQNP